LAVSVKLAKSVKPENISKSHIIRILRLALLAPDIVEVILAGKMDQAPMLERPLPANWKEQRSFYVA
jgi:hypothetical protein